MTSAALEEEFPFLKSDKISSDTKSNFLDKIQYFQEIVENDNSDHVPNAKAALNLLRRSDYIEKIGIYNMIYFQHGRQYEVQDLGTWDEGPIDCVVSHTKVYH